MGLAVKEGLNKLGNGARARMAHSNGWGLLLLLLLGCAYPLAGNAEEIIRDQHERELHLNINPHFGETERAAIREWIEYLSHSLTLVYGHWPRNHWGIDVEPVSGSSNDPIPWAQVHREGMDRVVFYVVNNVSSETLKREWTGYHELSHLLLPYRGWGDTWFSEGLASYYQNILQARAGIISEQQMWQKLHDGFSRGRADSRFDGQPLLTVNQRMREHGGYMRVYWSGAWYFLTADIALREQSDGKQSLDNALARLNDCCASASLSVAQIIARMDEGNDKEIFSELYQQVYQSPRQPDFEPLLSRLGVTLADGKVVLAQSGPAAQRRRQFLASTAL